jgi:pimeloyl-ACP methyl ester carboxylesterase
MYKSVGSAFVPSGMSSGEVIRLQSYLSKQLGKAVNMDSYQHLPMFESFAHPGTRIYERNCEVDGDAIIRILHFQPHSTVRTLPLVIVPGLSSVIESFRGVLQEITRTHVVIYVETREKPSSNTSDNCCFDMSSFARDLEVSIAMAGLEDDGYLLVGYSLGAAAIMESFQRLPVKPVRVVLAEPVPQFRIPVWSLPLARWAPILFPVIKPFAKWYMRNFMIDTKKDPEVMRIVERALDAADPVKLGRTLRSLYQYEAWGRLHHIDRPTHIIATSGDTLHKHDDILRMNDLIPGSKLLDMVDNRRTHSRDMALLLRELS